MHALHDEADQGAAFFFRPEHAHARPFGQPFRRISGQSRIMSKNRWASNPLEIIDRGCESDGAGNIWRAGLKTMRCSLKSAFLECDADNHFAAPVPGRERFHDRGSTV